MLLKRSLIDFGGWFILNGTMSDDQFTKLSKQLADQAARLDERFDKVEGRLGKQDETFLKLYAHFERRFTELSARLDQTTTELKSEINRVYDLVDQDVKHRETDEQERTVVNHQLDRHEDWIGRASKQLGVSYEP